MTSPQRQQEEEKVKRQNAKVKSKKTPALPFAF
jgi:hypothetical protein